MKKVLTALVVLVALVCAFVGGSWWTLRNMNVTFEPESGLYILESCGRGEYYYFSNTEDE